MAEAIRTRMTAEEYLALPETTQRMDLIDGKVIVSPSPIQAHQTAVHRTARHIEDLAPNGMIVVSPMDLRLDDKNVPQPDVFWVSDTNTNCHLIDGKYWQGPPDLLVEVLSPSTAYRDYGDKFQLYERSGVLEYWIEDAVSRFVQVYALENGKYVRLGAFGPGETFTSAALGVEVDVNKLFGAA